MPAPGQFFPRKSGAHRIACIALYRALLKQCPLVPLPADLPLRGSTNPLTHLVRKEFRKNVYHTSPKMVVSCLESGYAVHNLLNHAITTPPSKPKSSLTQIHALLHHLSDTYTTAKTVSPPKPPTPKRIIKPVAPSTVLSRPLPNEKLSGRRVVPTLVVAHTGFPFLRYKKPQSPYLSRMLRQKLKRKQMWHIRVDELGILAEDGNLEDQWDRLVEKVEEDEDGWVGEWSQDEEGWGYEAKEEERATWRKIRDDGNKAMEMGRKMMRIVEEEKELWLKEKKERKREKRETRSKWRKERAEKRERKVRAKELRAEGLPADF